MKRCDNDEFTFIVISIAMNSIFVKGRKGLKGKDEG